MRLFWIVSALDLDENADDVAATLIYLSSCGLAESSDNEQFFFPYAIENVGSETSAAERMRKMGDRNTVTPLLRDRYGEKEIEIEKEIETEVTDSNESVCRTGDIRRVKEAWNSLGLSQILTLTSDSKRGQMLKSRIIQNSVDKMLEDIRIFVKRGKTGQS